MLQQQLTMRSVAQTIQNLADEFSLPMAKVQQVLSSEIQRLERGARIKQFVLLLAVKRTKEVLRSIRHIPSRAA